MLGKILLIIIIFSYSTFFSQNKDSLVDKNKESIALLKEKIANLENGISPEAKNEVLEKEIIIYRDSLVYLIKELEVCSAEKELVKEGLAEEIKKQVKEQTKQIEEKVRNDKALQTENVTQVSKNSNGGEAILNPNLKESNGNNFYFSKDIYKLSKDNERALDAYVLQLPSNYLFIVIKGHADNTGGETLNETISRKRANAIKEYLINEKNIAPDKIMINWFGSDMPSVIGDDKRCELSVI